MSEDESPYRSATQLADRITRREISSVEVVEDALRRIEEVNDRCNAFCFVYSEEARDAAKAADRHVAEGRALGPLHGLPFALKDLTPTTGKRTTFGSKVFEDNVPAEQPAIVDRLIGAGGILLGKTTTPEFAHAGTTESRLWGVTRNPWNLEHTPGGSSGGSAVAVATGCVPLAEGSDGGGSIRIPASCCGVFGMKPSLGRVPITILPTTFEPILQFGPMARTVGDLRLMLQIMAGYDDRDIQTLPLEPVASRGNGIPISERRVALSIDLGFYFVAPEVRALVESAADRLRDLGATVDEVELDWSEDIYRAWITYWHVMLAAFFGEYLPDWKDSMDPDLVLRIEDGRNTSAVELRRLEILRTKHWHALCDVFERYDTLMCPTLAEEPLRLDQEVSALKHRGLDAAFHGFYMTLPFNLISQCPAMSVPIGNSKGGLPIGMQIVGHKFADNDLIDMAELLEDAGIARFSPPPS